MDKWGYFCGVKWLTRSVFNAKAQGVLQISSYLHDVFVCVWCVCVWCVCVCGVCVCVVCVFVVCMCGVCVWFVCVCGVCVCMWRVCVCVCGVCVA
jgi:hypothetical protein